MAQVRFLSVTLPPIMEVRALLKESVSLPKPHMVSLHDCWRTGSGWEGTPHPAGSRPGHSFPNGASFVPHPPNPTNHPPNPPTTHPASTSSKSGFLRSGLGFMWKCQQAEGVRIWRQVRRTTWREDGPHWPPREPPGDGLMWIYKDRAENMFPYPCLVP